MATLTKEEIRNIVADGVEHAFERMGIDAHSPMEMQRDLQFLRANRQRCESVINKAAAWAVISILSIGSMMSIGNFVDKIRGL